MNGLPKISIITPSFNQAAYLEETILSVIEQDYPNLEYLVVDGKSEDGSVAILQKFQHHFTWWVSEKDKGQSEAINKGLKRASGELLLWLNSDDRLMPGALNKAAEFFRTYPDAQFIHGQALLTGTGIKDKLVGTVSDNLPARYLAYIPFPQPASFFRKSLLEEVGLLNEHLHYGMDYEFLVRSMLNGAVPQKVEFLFSKYRIHSESKSGNALAFSREWAHVFSKLLRSVPGSQNLTGHLRKAGLYQEGKDTFVIKKDPGKAVLQQALCYHLLVQAHYHYNALDLKSTVRILDALKLADIDFYTSNQLSFLRTKSRLLPSSGIAFIRKFSRK